MFCLIPLGYNNKGSEYDVNLEKYLICNDIFIRLRSFSVRACTAGVDVVSIYLPRLCTVLSIVAVSGSIHILGLGASFKSLRLPRSLCLVVE